MRLAPPVALALIAFLLIVDPVGAQTRPVEDREVSWRAHAAQRAARVRVFTVEDERRPHTIVVDDRASNGGPITDEAQFVADLVGREVGVDPTAATFVFRFPPSAFAEGAGDGGKTLLLRATFRRTKSGGLGTPDWRVLTVDGLGELTDRATL